MPDKVKITKTKLDNLANAVAAKSGQPVLLTVDQMTDAVLGINLGEENILEGVKVNNVELPIVDKKVNIPAATVSSSNPGKLTTAGVVTQKLWDDIGDSLDYYDDAVNDIYNLIGSINNAGYITEETDPTVPSWAKQSTKPTYTAAEVGALPDTTIIPEDKVFIATYGTTTYADTLAAYNAGKLIFAKNTNHLTILVSYNSNRFIFSGGRDYAEAITFWWLDRSTGWGNANPPYNSITTGSSIESGDYIPFVDINSSNRLSHSASLTFGTATNQYLANNGTWQTIPENISDLTNDSGYLTEETDPTVPSWAKASTKPSYNFSEIGSTPTTINGYGITDAYTKTQVDGLVAGVLHYKGTKAAISNLPTSGNTTGDTWHITADGSEWAWDGTTWQELGTAVDLSNYVTTDDSRLSDARTPTAHNQALSTITGADDLKAIEGLTGTNGLLKKTAANTWTLDTSNYLTSYTETDPVFSASAAANISSTDINNWNKKSNLWTVSSGNTGSEYYWTLAISQNNLHNLANAPGYNSGIDHITLPVSRNGNVYSNVQLQLPITNGTIALTSDIPDTSSFLISESDPVFSASAAANISSTDISNWNSKTSNTGTVTSIGLSNATNGGLTISGSPITDSGSITVGHSNVLSSAQTTQAVYPIKIDKNGHISAYGSAVTITDEKVKQTPLNGLNSGKGLLFSYSMGNSETTNTVYTSDKIMWNDYSSALSIHNSDRSKYSNLTYSNLSLSNSSTNYKGLLGTVNVTANRNYNLPDKSGTVALTSDIPSVYSSTNTGGYLTMDTLPIYDGTVV